MIRRPPRSTLFPTRRSSDLYAQTAGYNNESGSVYYAADSYADDRWENFYIMLAQFRALEDKYNKETDRKSTRLNSSHANISYAVFCLKKKKDNERNHTISCQ